MTESERLESFLNALRRQMERLIADGERLEYELRYIPKRDHFRVIIKPEGMTANKQGEHD